jgi:hypothetical protein
MGDETEANKLALLGYIPLLQLGNLVSDFSGAGPQSRVSSSLADCLHSDAALVEHLLALAEDCRTDGNSNLSEYFLFIAQELLNEA